MTIRIRIPVRTDELGNWAAYGWGGPNGASDDDQSRPILLDMMDACQGGQELWAYVTADVPIPETASAEVRGEVEGATP